MALNCRVHSYGHRTLEREVELGLRRNLHLLAVSPGLHRSSCARARYGADCGAFPTPCNRADEGAEYSSSADRLSRASATRGPGLLMVAGLKLIRLAACGYADQLNLQLRTAAHVPGACGLHQPNARVGVAR